MISCYFSEDEPTMVNHSGENICGTGACKSNKANTLPLKELSYSFCDNTASKQTTPLNLNITGLKYSCPMESKLDFPSFKGKKKSLLSKANLFLANSHLKTSKHSVFKNSTNMKVCGLVTSFNTGLIGHPGTLGMLKHQ